jgi:hypothetical protein
MSPVWAAVAMLAQNVLAVFLVQAEARNRALLAGLLDCLMWPAGMITTTITVTALQGHHAGLKGEVIAAVTLANFVGSSAAVSLGRRFISLAPLCTGSPRDRALGSQCSKPRPGPGIRRMRTVIPRSVRNSSNFFPDDPWYHLLVPEALPGCS